MDIQITRETFGGIEQLSAQGARGKTTTVYSMGGTVFVQTSHKGVPKAFADMARPSKVARVLAQELSA